MKRLPSSVGVGRCLRCDLPCIAGWSHFDVDEGFCEDCAFLIAGPEFVREELGLAELADALSIAKADAVKAARIARRRGSNFRGASVVLAVDPSVALPKNASEVPSFFLKGNF